MFAELVAAAGIKAPPGHGPPRLHDLRHLRRLDVWTGNRGGHDVQVRLPLLSTWLGHVDPALDLLVPARSTRTARPRRAPPRRPSGRARHGAWVMTVADRDVTAPGVLHRTAGPAAIGWLLRHRLATGSLMKFLAAVRRAEKDGEEAHLWLHDRRPERRHRSARSSNYLLESQRAQQHGDPQRAPGRDPLPLPRRRCLLIPDRASTAKRQRPGDPVNAVTTGPSCRT